MLKPASMAKVGILVLEEDLEGLTRSLQEEGLVQLSEGTVPSPMGRHEVRELENRAISLKAKVERMLSLLEGASSRGAGKEGAVARIKRALSPATSPEPFLVRTASALETIGWCEEQVREIGPELDSLGEAMKRASERRARLEEDLRLIRDMLPIKVPLARFRSTEMISTSFFYLPAERVDQFSSACRDQIDPIHVSVISGTRKRLVMALGLSIDRVKILTQIHRFEGEIVEIPPYEETPAAAEKAVIEAMQILDSETEQMADRLAEISGERLHDLRITAEALENEEERVKAHKLLGRTEHVAYLQGWVIEDDLDRLENVLSKATDGRYHLSASAPDPGESRQVPISLSNRWPFSSFEWITKMYGLPHYREIDPTPLIMPTFAVFFGTCLTDAGYGLLLAIISFFFLRRMWGQKVGWAFTLCGLATVLMGWLTGGWFGNILSSPDYGPNIAFFKPAWIDPLSQNGAIPFLAMVLLFGLAHLLLGHITAIISSARKGAFSRALVTNVGWCMTLIFGSIYILWSLLGTVSGWEASQTWKDLSTWGLIGGVALGMMGYVWSRAGASRAAGPAQFMYDILGHVADTVSYSRLLALGISSSVNAYLIDLLIMKFVWPRPGPGAGLLTIILAVLLAVVLSAGFVFLHLANMGLSCLSGFVHTMRLHFAEYFGKFYEAGGDEFLPFRSKRILTAVAMPEGGGG